MNRLSTITHTLVLSLICTTAAAQPTTVVEVPTWNPEALHQAIAEASVSSSGTAAPLTIRIVGTGSLKTQGIEWLPGLIIDCGGTGYYKPQLKLVDHATEDLIVYPERLKLGGGGSGKLYQHHAVIRGCTIDGNAANQDGPRNAVQVYNGGFQNRIEDSHIKNASGYCVYGERTALNLTIRDTDFSDCALGAGYFDYFDMYSGILKIENGQVDNCGPYAFTVRTAKTSSPSGHLSLFHFEALQFEWQRGEPKAAFRIISDGSHRPIALYESITLTTWIGDGRTYQMDAVIVEEGSGLPGVHNLNNVAARADQVPLIFRSKITGTRARGRNGLSNTRFQDHFTYGRNSDE